MVDNNLRFEEYVNQTVKASQRTYIIRTFLYHSRKPLASVLFSGFIVATLTYVYQFYIPKALLTQSTVYF